MAIVHIPGVCPRCGKPRAYLTVTGENQPLVLKCLNCRLRKTVEPQPEQDELPS